jgi:predicted Fe-S protein YdhL (DUF1289 family)
MSARSTEASPETPAQVASPCISLCVMDAAGELCIGCFRTLDEIAAWSVLDASAKRAVLAALPARRAQWRTNDR